jgi:transposase
MANVPRVKYPDGHTELVSVPWAQPHGRFTLMFEGWAIAVLRATRTVSDACALLDLSWDTAQTIMEGAVKRGIEGREVQNIQRVGIDEKSFGRGQDYISVLTDLDQARVIEVVPGRDKGAACALFKTLPAQQLEKVQAVAMDMSESFGAAAREMAPKADIVYDRFHVSQALNQAVDQVRRAENKALLAEGDERLKGTRQTWLFNPKNLQDHRLESLSDLARQNLKTSRAWLHKENFEGFWDMESRWHGQRYLRDWYNSAIRSRLEPIKRVARTLKAHASGLINYFTHHITNAVTEGLNSRIQDLKSAARGFRNFHHYRIRILFFCGKLQLQPAVSA